MSTKVFISHNKADKPLAREVGAQLMMVGVDVWLDEWSIDVGESIPAAINAGLRDFTHLVLLWSENAARSGWVQGELDSATMRLMSTPDVKVIPCFIDATPLPPLISSRKGIDFRDPGVGTSELCDAVTGTLTRKKRLLAISKALEEMDVTWFPVSLFPPMPCCPGCGADTDALTYREGWAGYGDHQAWFVTCKLCKWGTAGDL